MSPSENYAVREYLDADGRCPYGAWFEKLPAPAAAKVAIAVTRMALGNPGDTKSVGAGVHERRIDAGPGYRIYFGRDGDRLIILLGGGTKRRQGTDIERAQALWREYKLRKRTEAR